MMSLRVMFGTMSVMMSGTMVTMAVSSRNVPPSPEQELDELMTGNTADGETQVEGGTKRGQQQQGPEEM